MVEDKGGGRGAFAAKTKVVEPPRECAYRLCYSHTQDFQLLVKTLPPFIPYSTHHGQRTTNMHYCTQLMASCVRYTTQPLAVAATD
jgi:hypothetical protein